jgi:hypothetical protein
MAHSPLTGKKRRDSIDYSGEAAADIETTV